MNSFHLSETNEHGTPPDVIDAVWSTLKIIDLDPASCEKANAIVDAHKFYDIESNGFDKPWAGRVFLNPPGGLCDAFGRRVIKKTKAGPGCSETGACGLPVGHRHEGLGSSAVAWWKKLMREYTVGNVEAAVFVGFSLEILQTTQTDPGGLPIPLDFPLCVPRRRVNYVELAAPGVVISDSATHASFFACVAPTTRGERARFRKAFARFGAVIEPREIPT